MSVCILADMEPKQEHQGGAAAAELNALIQALPDLVLVVDADGRIVKIAPTNATPALTAVGLAPHDFFPKDVAEQLIACVRSALDRGTPQQIEYAADVESRRRWFVGTAAPLSNERALWIAREITEFRDVAEQLQQAQKMEAIGRLAGGIAHDFNNLLTVIATNTALASKEVSETGNARWALENIAHATERATDLTRQLLAFSRKRVLSPTVVDLNDVVRRTEKMLSRVIGEDVTFVTEFASAPLPVRADTGQLDQVLLNLVVNARDAMPSGGALIVSTSSERVAAPRAAAGASIIEGFYAVLRVRDSGIGMDAVTRTRIFEPFFTTKPAGAGTGLGLASVYGIVHQFSGYVRVESAVGDGSMFEVFLPCHELVTGSCGPQARDHAVPAGGAERILLVEDEASVRHVMERSLRDRGYEVMVAVDGLEAEQIIRREHLEAPALIIADVVMPHAGGGEVAAQARQRWPEVAVLFVSGYADIFRDKGLPDRSAFLQKPFDGATLTGVVRELLDRE